MAIDARDFSMVGQFAKGALTVVPPNPISGQAYRNPNVTQAEVESGQPYNQIGASAFWNQLLYMATGMSKLAEIFSYIPWSPFTNYIGEASWCLGLDGIPYRAIRNSGNGTPTNPDVGPKPPPNDDYWETLADYVKRMWDGSGGGGGNIGTSIFSSRMSGIWTVPENIRKILVLLTGAGGSGGKPDINGDGSGGGGGATAMKYIDVTPGQQIAYTIGAGGVPAGTPGGMGGNGGASTCLGIVANGGTGGYPGTATTRTTNRPCPGGIATGGDFNFAGGWGQISVDLYSGVDTGNHGGDGGSSFWGPGAEGVTYYHQVAEDGVNPGSGGGGGYGDYSWGWIAGRGADGIILIQY